MAPPSRKSAAAATTFIYAALVSCALVLSREGLVPFPFPSSFSVCPVTIWKLSEGCKWVSFRLLHYFCASQSLCPRPPPPSYPQQQLYHYLLESTRVGDAHCSTRPSIQREHMDTMDTQQTAKRSASAEEQGGNGEHEEHHDDDIASHGRGKKHARLSGVSGGSSPGGGSSHLDGDALLDVPGGRRTIICVVPSFAKRRYIRGVEDVPDEYGGFFTITEK